MKKLLLALVLFGTALFGMSNVSAAEISLDDIDTNSYIIGDRVYELNTYYLSIYDVVSATNEYAKNHNNDMAPIYYLAEKGDGSKYLLEILGSADSNGQIPKEEVEIETVYPDSVMDATAINNVPLYDYVEENVEPLIEEAVETLNETASEYGFSSVTYEDKTVTFKVEDLTASLEEYKNSDVIALFQSVLNGATKVEYTLGEAKSVDLTVLNETKLIGLAKEVLEFLSTDGELTLGSVVDRSISATVTFEHEGFEYTGTYTLAFEKGVVAEKDEALTEVVTTLNETAANYGFESVEYDSESKEVTFTISNPEALLADYQNSGVVSLFMTNIEGATKAVYTVNGTEYEEDLTVINDTKVINLALTVLSSLAEGEELTLGAVAGKSFTADIYYEENGEEVVVTYGMNFVYDEIAANLATEKDEALTEVATTLNETASDYGFESVEYDSETNTATFTVSDPEALLEEYQNSDIISLFMTHIEGATKAVYTVNGTEYEEDLTVINDTKVAELALTILSSLSEDGELTLGSVAGKSFTANVTYLVDDKEVTLPYKVEFVMAQ